MSASQAPFMLETAYYYLRAAKILLREPKMEFVAQINGALGTEILLKSFRSVPEENDKKGTLAEEYKFIDGRMHKLTALASSIDEKLCRKLKIDQHKQTIQRYDDYFINSRYHYEKNVTHGYDGMIIVAGIEIFRETIAWYKETNSSDPWIINYPNIPGGEL